MMEKEEQKGLGIFEKYLTLWVALCMVTGVLIGKYLPAVPATLGEIRVLSSIYSNSNLNLVDDLSDDVENRFY